MKKTTLMAFLLALLAPIMSAWAGTTYYAKLTVGVASSSTGRGTVYAAKSDTATTGSADATDSSSTKTITLYAFAKPNYGYKLKGWATDAAGNSIVANSNKSPFPVQVDASNNTSSSSPKTEKRYAVFETNTDSYTLTLNKPEGLASYTVTAPSGFPENLSQGGSVTVYKGDQYTFKYTLTSDQYDFINWTVNGVVKETASITVDIDGNTTVNLNVKKKVTYYATCQVAEGGSYTVKSNGSSSSVNVSDSEKTVSGYPSITVDFSNPKPNDGYAFYGWYILHTNGANAVKEYLSYYSSASTGVKKENLIVGAEFRAVEDYTINFIAPQEGRITYAISGGNSGVVNDDNIIESVQSGKSVTLTAVSDFESRRAKWYTKDEDDFKTYFSIDNTLTKTFPSSVTVGVDFVPVNTNIMNAIEAAQSHDTHTAMLSADAEVVFGSSVVIPSEITIDLNGHTLYVDGTLTVNGTLTGGIVSKCTKLIRQTGDGLEPFNPYGSVKYWKTAISTPSISVSSSQTHATVLNGLGCAFRTTLSSSAKLIKATVDTTVAVNHIKSLTGESTSVNVVNATLNDGMVILLCSDCVINGGLNAKEGFRGVVDCAGNTCQTISNQEVSGNSGVCQLLNCPSFTISKAINITHNYYNCSSVTVSSFNAGNTPILNFYDCGTPLSPATFSVTSFSKGPSDTTVFNFRGGHYTLSHEAQSKIYGGSYTSKPTAEGIIAIDGYEFYQHADRRWYLEESQDESVAKIGSQKYLTVEAAFSAAIASGSAKIEMLRNATVEERLVLPEQKTIEIEFNGRTITSIAQDGLILNRGTLLLGDRLGRMSNCGLSAANGCLIENHGTVEVVYGAYQGSILNNAGTFTLYNGLLVGALTRSGGTVNLRGGHFSSNVAEFVTENGYDIVKDGDGRYCVCELPNGTMYNATVSGVSGYGATPYIDNDFSLLVSKIKDGKRDRSNYSDANWKRLAELLCFYQVFGNKGLDATLRFDRSVAKDSINLYAQSTSATSVDFNCNLSAGEPYRALTEVMIKYKSHAKTYYSLFDENIRSVAMAVTDGSGNNNKGTICNTMIELWTDARAPDYTSTGRKVTNTVYVVGQKFFTLGAGSNKAMIRPATGAATFYSTLSAAMGTVANGGTVMLANDCTEKPNFTKEGTYIIDSMGFENSFSDAEGGYTVADGLAVSTEIVPSSADMLVPGAVAIKYVVSAAGPSHPADFVVIPSVPAEWEAANGLEGLTSEDLKNEDANGNATWENAVMGQNRTTPAAIVTSTNGTETTANMEVSFNPPSGIGYTVKYAFDEVAIVGAATNVVHEGSVTNNPTLDLSGVTTNSPSYFKMRAVLESTDDKHTITTNVPVDKVIGVLKVDSDAKYTIIAAPWKSFGDGDVKVSELVHAASLSEDDMITAYDDDGNTKSWRVNGGVWVSMKETAGGEQGATVESDPPAEFGLARGKGVWLRRENVKSPIYLMGQPPTSSETATTRLTPAKDENTPSWNLVASPKLEAVDIATSTFNTDDEIIVPTAGTPKHYTYKDGAWGYPGASVTTTKPGPGGTTITVIESTRKTDDTTISPGKGFWYLNKGTGSKTVSW